MCLSNFKAIQQFKVPISWLRDFTRSYEKTSFGILRRGPGRGPTGLQARVRNRSRLENRSHVVPKTGFQDGGDRTRIFTRSGSYFREEVFPWFFSVCVSILSVCDPLNEIDLWLDFRHNNEFYGAWISPKLQTMVMLWCIELKYSKLPLSVVSSRDRARVGLFGT